MLLFLIIAILFVQKEVDMQIKNSEFFTVEAGILAEFFALSELPWDLLVNLGEFISAKEEYWLQNGYRAVCSKVWVQNDTWIKSKGLLHPPIVIGQNCTIGDMATIRPNVFIGDDVTIGNGCIVKRSIILPGAKLLGNNMVSDSIIGAGVILGPGVNITNQYAPVLSPPPFIKINGEEVAGLKRFGAIIGDGSNIAANVRVNPGTVIGKGCFVESFDVRGVLEHHRKLGISGEESWVYSKEEKSNQS